MRARWTWSKSAWPRCGRVGRGRPSARAIGRGRCCSSIGPRCRHARRSPAASGASNALIASLPFSGAQTAHFSFDLSAESFLEGHVRAPEWLGGVPRECVYDNLRSVVARRAGDVIQWNPRCVALRGHYAFHATACTPTTPREKGAVEGAVRYLKTGFWPARRIAGLADLDAQSVDWRECVCNRRRHATGGFWVHERLEVERHALRPLPPTAFDHAGRRSTRVPTDGYLKLGGCVYRAPEPLVHQRAELRHDRDGSGSATAG
jgi:hypothetical protein